MSRPGLPRWPLNFRFPRLPRRHPGQPAAAEARPVPGILRKPRDAALVMIAVLVTTASLVSFSESYRGLYLWAHHHDLYGAWAALWPVQVDTFVAVGELALFIALVDQWSMRSRIAGWLVTVVGLAVSVAGNIGHVAGHSITVRGTAAIPPVAAASALAVGLGVLKRVVKQQHTADRRDAVSAPRDGSPTDAEPDAENTPRAAPEPLAAEVPTTALGAARVALAASVRGGNALSARALERQFGIPRNQATKMVRELATTGNGRIEN